jgi:hemoglobin/transferrin/lactoferrin receptor protein
MSATSLSHRPLLALADVYGNRGTDEGHTLGGSIQADFNFGNHYLIIGFDADRANAHSVGEDVGTYYRLGDDDDRKGYNQSLAFFAQDEWRVAPNIIFTFGLRYTSNENNLTHNKVDPSLVTSVKTKAVVGSLGLVYSGDNGLSLRALVSQGFRSPTLTQQLLRGTGRYIPNLDLTPEKSINYEMGARYNARNWNIDLSLFYSVLKDAFYAQETDVPHPISGNYMQFQNSDRATSYGVELATSYLIEAIGLTPYLSMTAMKYVRDYKNGYKTDNTDVPRTRGIGGLRWERNLTENFRLYTDASLTWFGGFHPEYPNGAKGNIYDSGLRADFIIGVEGGQDHKYKAALNFRNIGDERYEPDGYFLPGFHVVGTLGYEF